MLKAAHFNPLSTSSTTQQPVESEIPPTPTTLLILLLFLCNQSYNDNHIIIQIYVQLFF